MNKVAFYTLGCKLNFSETSTIARTFQDHGFRKVEFNDSPDIFVINTCSVTDNADKKCRKVIRDARRVTEDPYIIVVGCYAQLKPNEIASIPGVDAVMGANEKFRIFELIDRFQKGRKASIHTSDIEEVREFHNAFSLNVRTRTFLKVQDGCDYSCSFCTIPLARGKSRSDTIENVVQNAREIAAGNVKEIVLTGVNTGDFGIRKGQREDNFIDLLKALDNVEGIERFRISSIEPNLLTDEIIRFVADSKLFSPHFHIPLQSGSDKMLKGMRRRYLTNTYANRVDTIRTVLPDACIGVDVIVGFPGEGEQEFMDTYRFLNDLDVSYFHVFTYSERANTPASDLNGQVPLSERHERSKMLRSLSARKRRHFYTQQLGKNMRVLFENDVEHGLIHGFTDNYIRVATVHDPMLVNQTANVKLLSINEEGNVNAHIPEGTPALNTTS